MAWVTFARSDFELIAGRPAAFRSSPPVVRTFCSACGTPLTYCHEDWPEIIDIAVGTLDAPNEVPPTDHIWMSDALAWDKPNDGLKQYSGSRL